jgi:hypothetical protein
LNNSVSSSTSSVNRWKPLFEGRLFLSEKKLLVPTPPLCLHTPNLPFQQTKVMQVGFISILAVSISKVLGLNQVLTWILITFKHRLPPALNACSTT